MDTGGKSAGSEAHRPPPSSAEVKNMWSYTYTLTLGYGLDDRGSRVRFPAGLGIFLFITVSRTALGPTQPPIQCVSGALSLGVKRPGREADHSPPSSADVKNAWSYTSTHPIRLHGVVLS
jgi:hypothetical protein